MRRKTLVPKWSQTFDECLREGINSGILRHPEPWKALLKLGNEYLRELDIEEAKKEVLIIKTKTDEFWD